MKTNLENSPQLRRFVAACLHVHEEQVNILKTTTRTVSGRVYMRGQWEEFAFRAKDLPTGEYTLIRTK